MTPCASCFFEVSVDFEYDTPKDRMYTLRLSAVDFVCSFSNAYHDTEREHIVWLVELASEVPFRTAPTLVAWQHSLDAPPFRQICRVFKITDFDILDQSVSRGLAPIDQNIIWLDI